MKTKTISYSGCITWFYFFPPTILLCHGKWSALGHLPLTEILHSHERSEIGWYVFFGSLIYLSTQVLFSKWYGLVGWVPWKQILIINNSNIFTVMVSEDWVLYFNTYIPMMCLFISICLFWGPFFDLFIFNWRIISSF